MSDLVAKSADALPATSRNFYENAAFKLFLSFVWSAIGLFFLGMCSQTGGLSQRFTNLNEQDGLSDDEQADLTAQQTGYGFAAFFFFCAFALMIGAAFHISPVVNGSPKEATTLRRPVDLER